MPSQSQKEKRIPVLINPIDIPKYVEQGKDNKNWYAECEHILINFFGDKYKLAAEILAATSINTSLTSNVKLFSKAWVQIHEDLPFTGYLPNIQKQLQQIKAGTGITGQKIQAFRNAMTGDENAIVADIWIARAFKVHKTYFRSGDGRERSAGISKGHFDAITRFYRSEAPYYGLQPREMCSMTWAGIRRETFPREKTHYRDYLAKHFSTMKLF